MASISLPRVLQSKKNNLDVEHENLIKNMVGTEFTITTERSGSLHRLFGLSIFNTAFWRGMNLTAQTPTGNTF